MQRDSTKRHVKSLDVVLGADTSVLILDDTEGVWPAHAANLIQVDRYIFFPACVSRYAISPADVTLYVFFPVSACTSSSLLLSPGTHSPLRM